MIYEIVGNKAKGWTSKRVLKQSAPNFPKTNIFYPVIRTRACAYQGVRNVPFPENLACFVFLSHPFWESPFFLITGDIYFLGFAEKERRLSGFRFLKKSLIHYKSVYPKCHFVFLINRNVKSEIKFWFSFLYWSWDRKHQNN